MLNGDSNGNHKRKREGAVEPRNAFLTSSAVSHHSQLFPSKSTPRELHSSGLEFSNEPFSWCTHTVLDYFLFPKYPCSVIKCRSVATRALTNCVPLFCFSFASFLFLLFPSISIDVGVFLLFPNGFLLCDHRLDFWDRLMWEFNQNQSTQWLAICNVIFV